MRDGEWRIVYPGTDYLFGTRATPVFNHTTPDVGDVDLRAADVDRPRSDGRAFGVDFFGAQTISFDLGVSGAPGVVVRENAAALKRAWRGDTIRSTPGAVAELHAQYAGRERLVYGRPRRFSADYTDAATNGLVGVTADFACVDDVFYDPIEHSQPLTLAVMAGGGLLAPLSAPLTSSASSDRSVGIDVAGELGAWPVIEINGPITNPVIEVVDVFRIELRTTLSYDDVAVIDARPWARSTLRNGTGNLSGALRGTRLSKTAILPGSYEVALRGVDPTGTSSARLRWRSAFSTL